MCLDRHQVAANEHEVSPTTHDFLPSLTPHFGVDMPAPSYLLESGTHAAGTARRSC